MYKAIAEMISVPDHQLRKLISKLEDKNGYPSHDVRMLAENIQKTRIKLSELGLDPDDTTAEELYHALQNKFHQDSIKFDEYFGVGLETPVQKMQTAAKIVSKNVQLPESWVLKASAAKYILKQHPPKKVMKQLHYRSVDSLLKRQDLAAIYLLVKVLESTAWNKSHAKLINSLDSTAFEYRAIKIANIPQNDLNISYSETSVLQNEDFGVIGLQLWSQPSDASLLYMTVCLLDELASITDIKVCETTASFSPAAAWWSELDFLIARIGDTHISMNIKDVAENHASKLKFDSRKLGSAQKTFWKELQSRYENQIEPAEDLLPNMLSNFKFTAPFRHPVYEYAEEA